MAREERDRHIAVTEDGRTLPTVEILTGRGFVCGKSGSGKSIREGTPVHTENGRKPIEAVAENERVLSLDKHTFEQEFRPVQAVIEHDADDLVEITLEDGTELVGTEDHSFLTIEDMEITPIEGSEVTEGTWFPLARELPSTESIGEIDLAEYASEGPNLTIGDTGMERAKALGKSDIQWKRVVDVTPLSGEETVYDLDVAVNDNFVANGVFVHNSNTASVIVEELLADGYNLLIVDTEGEYYGLKERFEVLHAGADEFCDVEVTPDDAASIAEAALVENVPVILDVSGYFDAEEAQDLIHDVVAHLFRIEKRERKPFLLLIEELQEYLPQTGGGTDLAKLLKRIGKRGRKRGFGICGLSQRPSSVDKDFITQCDWLVWHRLTWKNDVSIAGDVLGSERADLIQGFDAGEGFLLTDWDDTVDRVRFRRKTTHDAGATPGLDSYDTSADRGADDRLAGGSRLEAAAGIETAVDRDRPERGNESTAGDGSSGANDGLDRASADADGAHDSPDGGQSIDGTDRGEREAAVEREQRRNRTLEDEVADLRASKAERSTTGDAGDDAVDEDAGSRARRVIDVPNDIVSAPRQRPTPPSPPVDPGDRTGVGGVVAEIGDLSVFVLRALAYRCRLGSYLLRRRLAGDDR